MTLLDKIQKAKARLMLEHPYFGTIASALKIEQSDNIEAFLSDGIELQYNDEYFEKASLEEIEFALANGAMHTVLSHGSRVGDRYGWLWQLATDYTVNAMLVQNGLELPSRANFQERFDGMYAEEVYEMLRSEIMNEELSTDESLSEQGHNEKDKESKDKDSSSRSEEIKEEERHRESMAQDSVANRSTSRDKNEVQQNEDEELSEEQMEALRQELQEEFEQIFQKLNRQGTLPKNLEFVLPEYFSHRVDWREFLQGYIDSYAKSTYSFMPPNMKYLYRGIYLPSLSSDLLRIVIAIDTSGSVDEKLLSIFLGEISSIMQIYPNYELDLIMADAKVQSHKVFLPGEVLEYEIKGRGGTDFRPVFALIDQEINYPTLLLYFTDGQGVFPEEEVSYDVLWVMPKEEEVPFGEILILDLLEV